MAIAIVCNGIPECAEAGVLSMNKNDKFNPHVFAMTVLTGMSM